MIYANILYFLKNNNKVVIPPVYCDAENIYYIFRSKITPIKEGEFVCMWKKDTAGRNVSYNINDAFHFFVILLERNAGCFIFDKDSLVKNNIISSPKTRGKLGMRVYPFLINIMNKQASETYQWQKKYFYLF